MKKNEYFKYIYSILFFCILIIGVQYSHGIQSKQSDPASVQWDNRPDVKKAAAQLNEALQELEMFVQNIYNAYAPYTIGAGKVMRDRIKALSRLVAAAGQIEGINVQYHACIGWKTSFHKKMTHTTKDIAFYYFNQELKTILGLNTNIITEIESALADLCDTKWHPDFVKVTKFNKTQGHALLVKIDAAIHAAMATIPGGANALKFNNH